MKRYSAVPGIRADLVNEGFLGIDCGVLSVVLGIEISVIFVDIFG